MTDTTEKITEQKEAVTTRVEEAEEAREAKRYAAAQARKAAIEKGNAETSSGDEIPLHGELCEGGGGCHVKRSK